MNVRRAAQFLVLLAALAPVAADASRPSALHARVCYLDLQTLAAPACAAPRPQARLR